MCWRIRFENRSLVKFSINKTNDYDETSLNLRDSHISNEGFEEMSAISQYSNPFWTKIQDIRAKHFIKYLNFSLKWVYCIEKVDKENKKPNREILSKFLKSDCRAEWFVEYNIMSWKKYKFWNSWWVFAWVRWVKGWSQPGRKKGVNSGRDGDKLEGEQRGERRKDREEQTSEHRRVKVGIDAIKKERGISAFSSTAFLGFSME